MVAVSIGVRKAIWLALASLILVLPEMGWAAPTKLISYQGRITDSNGQPIANGPYTIRFKLYAVSADCPTDAATQVWTETHDGAAGNPGQVTITNGLFSVILGASANSPLTGLSFDADYWVQVKVGANPVFSPCDRLTTAPFAANAINTDSCNSDAVCEATGLTVSANATLGDASGDSVTVNAGTLNFLNTTTTSLSNVANAWNIDSNTLSIDALNNRVGIGTASPSVALEVAGSALHSQNSFISIGDAAGTGNRAYLSSGGAYSSLSYNAYYAGGASWVENVDASPDFALEIDAASATKAFRFFYAPGAAGAPAWSEVATITSAGNMTILGDLTVTGGDVAGTASNALACSADATCDTKDVVPIANNTYTSGTSVNRWSNMYSVAGDFSGNVTMANTVGIYFNGSTANASRMYSASASDRLYVRSESTDNVAQFASYGLYLPQDGGGVNLYVGGDARIGYSSAADDDTLQFDDGTQYLRWSDGSGAFTLSSPLAVGSPGAYSNVYATQLHVVGGNMHVQGNEDAVGQPAGTRTRLRVGNAWGYPGLYAEQNTNATNQDLVLGATSGIVRIGPSGGPQSLYAGTIYDNGNRITKCTSVAVTNGGANACAAGWFAASFVNTTGSTGQCQTPYYGMLWGWGRAHQGDMNITDCFTGSLFCCTKY